MKFLKSNIWRDSWSWQLSNVGACRRWYGNVEARQFQMICCESFPETLKPLGTASGKIKENCYLKEQRRSLQRGEKRMENLPSVVADAMFGCSPRGLFRRCQVQSIRLRGKPDFFIRNLSNVNVVVCQSSFVWTTQNPRSTLYPVDIQVTGDIRFSHHSNTDQWTIQSMVIKYQKVVIADQKTL